MLGAQQRLVSLNVDVDFGGYGLGYEVDAIGAAGAFGGGEHGLEAAFASEGHDFVGVGRDQYPVELRTGAGGAVNPFEHRAAGDGPKDLTREAGGCEASGNDGEDMQ